MSDSFIREYLLVHHIDSNEKINLNDDNASPSTVVNDKKKKNIKKNKPASKERRIMPKCIGCGLCAIGCPLGRDGPPEKNN